MPPARASAHWLISPAAERRTSSSRKASFCLARSREPSQSTLYDIYALPSPAGLWRHSLQKTRRPHCGLIGEGRARSEEHTSELQSLMRTSYAVFCLNTKPTSSTTHPRRHPHNQPLTPLH